MRTRYITPQSKNFIEIKYAPIRPQIKKPAPNMNTPVTETSPLAKGRSFFADDTGHVVDRGNHLVCKLNLQMYKNKGTQR